MGFWQGYNYSIAQMSSMASDCEQKEEWGKAAMWWRLCWYWDGTEMKQSYKLNWDNAFRKAEGANEEVQEVQVP